MRIAAPPIVSMACHCHGCQKLTSGAYSLTLVIPAEGFELVEGETDLGGLHRAESQHHFCTHCKNWLYTTGVLGGRFVNFRPAMLEDSSWVWPYVDAYASEKLPGVATSAKLSYPQQPNPSEYPAIMAGFAQDGPRPS
jgi:hypothetical protein